MQTATIVAQWVVRLTGMTQVGLGLLFWTNRALTLVPVHMAIGLTFVLAVWTLAGLAARAGVGRGLVLLAALWGIVVLGLGITQRRLLPGPEHWVVEVLHFLVGIAAMALAARLATQIRTRRGGVPSLDAPPRPAERLVTE
jgi:hypothetical protein